MVLKPIANNAQVQRLTTALKNICRDYPAGGISLRELLQNADDARATEVHFILDDRSYHQDELIHPKLNQYQGPALLAYNNAVFTDKDFESLSRLGDSLKIDDGSTTGRFGRGFNSVYNWTDCPSIVSRNRLLILDPHCEFSAGGDMYDFVEDYKEAAIKNQMAAYQTVMKHLDQPFDGTIIRIPLRTPAQAKKSEISNKATTTSELVEVIQTFASDFGNNGLLFMRNIEKLELRAPGISVEIEMLERKKLRSHKSKVNNAVKQALSNSTFSFDHSFEVHIECRTSRSSNMNVFALHHSIQCGSVDNSLRAWVQEQRFVPWVAVAAPLLLSQSERLSGSLFTVLPLPIATSQPIHIHGLFSLSPDRARLHQNERIIQDQDPAEWNKWLFELLIPQAWTKLLGYLAQIYALEPAFSRWPRTVDDSRDPLNNSVDNVLKIIQQENLPLWPTTIGYVSAKAGMLYVDPDSPSLREAFEEAGIPVVYVPEELQQLARFSFKDRILEPESLCVFLRTQSARIAKFSEPTKHKLVEYVLSKPGFVGYDGLEIFPFMDGKYRSLGDGLSFVHRDKLEEKLFCLENSQNLDLKKLSKPAQVALRRRCEHMNTQSTICYRSATSLKKYCNATIFQNIPKNEDAVVLGNEALKRISDIWTWISLRGINVLDSEIASLWLLPLSNGQYRKITPGSSSSFVYIAPEGEVGDLMWKFDCRASTKLVPLLDTRVVYSKQVLSCITFHAMSSMFIRNASGVLPFISWLGLTMPMVPDVSGEERFHILNIIASKLPQDFGITAHSGIGAYFGIGSALAPLEIFQKVLWKVEGDQMIHTWEWVSLNSASKSFGLLDGVGPVPEVSGVQFLLAEETNPSRMVLQRLKIADCLTSVQAIQEHLIPAWKSGNISELPPSVKEQMSSFILRNFSSLSREFQDQVGTIPIVPVSQMTGKEMPIFSTPKDLIDPTILELKELCFDDECLIPQDSFFFKHGPALRGCGLKSALDEDVVGNRIRSYASGRYSFLDIQDRAQKMLESTCRWTSSNSEDSFIQRLAWLPTAYLDSRSLRSAKECRGRKDMLLVGSQLPLLELSISSEWEARLGWKNDIPSHILISQLKFGVQAGDRSIVDSVLRYISKNYSAQTNNHHQAVLKDVSDLACVFTTKGSFIAPSKTFQPASPLGHFGCEGLDPYIGNVERKFWQDHEKLLMKLGVREKPQLADLLNVQAILEAKPDLDKADVHVALELVKLATYLPSKMNRSGLKVISELKKFHSIDDINFDDLAPLKTTQEVNLTNQGISANTAKRLGIETLRERLIKGMLDIEDVEDEVEYAQKEDVKIRIADTLDRYPIETTFKEYLANAEDSGGASKISWRLDTRTHSCEKILTPKMKKLQGPALLVYNNGVFSESDFDGFKTVGQGSKEKNRGSIGQFGRGSQTMFHWTDCPMILSAKWMLILDPQQEILPINRYNGTHMPGVKLELSKMREACSDHLVPFEALWGFKSTLDTYRGTIFRFPLRGNDQPSRLSSTEAQLDKTTILKLMDNYFDEARISMLFLKHITSIHFKVLDKPRIGWSVKRSPPVKNEDGEEMLAKHVTFDFTINMQPSNHRIKGQDQWRIIIQALPASVRPSDSSRRLTKNAECGIAALISSDTEDYPAPVIERMSTSKIEPKIFTTLPLPIRSDLPVHIHATFDVSGDRKSIGIDEIGPRSSESQWNILILQEFLPKLYLAFLADIRDAYFQFWPREDPPKRTCAELLCGSFWQELPNSPELLFPRSQLNEQVLERDVQFLDIQDSVFDLLAPKDSEALVPLLLALDVDLVTFIPKEIAKHIKTFQNIKSVTGEMLRELMKLPRSKECLRQQMMVNLATLATLLALIMPKTAQDTNLKEFDGCHVLKILSSTARAPNLATLKFIDSPDTTTDRYYVPCSKGSAVFLSFASNHLVSPVIATQLGHVYNSRKFNLTPLRLVHVKKLVEMKPKVLTPDRDNNEWLAGFWEFWNTHEDINESTSKVDAFDAQLFLATKNGTDLYTTPVQFSNFPGVVEPSVREHKELCGSTPGLYQFRTKYMPKVVKNKEASFYDPDSFYRYLRALKSLSGGSGLNHFVRNFIPAQHIETLQNLVVHHVTLNDQSPLSTTQRADLKPLPLWPSVDMTTPGQLINADKALMATSGLLLFPWMKSYDRFVKPQFLKHAQKLNCLLKLGVQKLEPRILLKNHLLPLPATMSGTYWQHFQPFVAAISTASSKDPSLLYILEDWEIAADGSKTLRKASDLYDHTEPMFTSAFRLQPAISFVHNTLQSNRDFWLKIGLRYKPNGLISAENYIHCLRVLENRLMANIQAPGTDPHLSQDIQTVLIPLITTTADAQYFRTVDWTIIANLDLFLVRSVFHGESEYRRDTMISIAAQKRLLRLSEIISYDHAAVCWSQTPFAVHQPTAAVLNNISGNGNPTIKMVWQHLLYMKDLAQTLKYSQTQGFLIDLQATYKYLQDNLADSKASFDLQDKKSAWHKIDNLVLSSRCDSGPVKAVKETLLQSVTLLRTLGCSSIKYPTIERPDVESRSPLTKSLRKMRDDGQLLDITYSTEGRQIKAHRCVLASVSKKCAAQFNSNWTVEDVITFDRNDPESFLSFHTLSFMVNYAYEADIDWSDMQVSDDEDESIKTAKLHLLLDLHKGADYWLMSALRSEVEDKLMTVGGAVINLDNCEEIMERAEDVRALNFQRFCSLFIAENIVAVTRAHART